MISEFPLLVFTVFVGIPTGAYALRAVFPNRGEQPKYPWVFPLICVILLGVGLLGTLLHLHHPERVLNALSNPGAMITQEAYWSTLFGLMVAIDLVASWFHCKTPRAVVIVAAVAGIVLMLVTGAAYATSYNITPWAGPVTYIFFLTGNLAMGAAFLAIFDRALLDDSRFCKVLAALSAIAAIVLVLMAVQFAIGGSLNWVAMAVAAVIQAAVLFVLHRKSAMKVDCKQLAWILFALAFVSVVVARYAFYAACTF